MSPKKILAIKLRAMGDTIIMTAALEALRRAFPNSEIHLAVTQQWAVLLENFPGIQKIWPYERRKETTARARAVARLGFQLRKENFDCVINFHASPSSSLLAFGTGAPIRSVHFHGLTDKNRYSTVDIPGKGAVKPIIERDMDAIRALGVYIPEGLLPKIYLDSSEFVRGEEYITNLNFNSPVLALGIGASRPTKMWPIERFATLAILWCQKAQGCALAFTGLGEETLAQEFLDSVDDQLKLMTSSESEAKEIKKKITSLTNLPLRHVAAVLRQCDVFVGNDSGPKHMAVAVETPTVTVIGPEHPFEWHPYPKDVHPYLFIEGLACRKDSLNNLYPWCAIPVCVEERHKCMRNIKIETVLEECMRVARVQ